MEKIKATVISFIFYNQDNGYAVISMRLNKEDLSIISFKRATSRFTAVFKNGIPAKFLADTELELTGKWVDNPKFGEQFEVISFEEILPSTENGIVAYLSSGLFKGIGPKMAKKIYLEFGNATMDIIENSPDKLRDIKGLSNKVVDNLIEKWGENKAYSNTVAFFSQFGISLLMITKLYKLYGGESISIIKENPYILIKDLDGVGFKKADDIAMKLGVDKTDSNRINSCLDYVLSIASEDGHTFLLKKQLIDDATALLDIPEENVQEGLREQIEKEHFAVIGNDKIFLYSMYVAEKKIAEKVSLISKNGVKFDKELVNFGIEDIEDELNIKYNENQRRAIETAINSNVMILTGGPGTGKTTALMGIILSLQKLGLSISAAAPTGRAAKRMEEVTGLHARTIHRLLEYMPGVGFTRNEKMPLNYDVYIVDEFSMVNAVLMHNLLKAIKENSKLILVGDENQLPAIGPGNILHDMIASNTIPVITLNEIFRQAQGSKIIMNAHNIINNKPIIINNKDKDTDFFFIKETNPEEVERLVVDLVTNRLPKAYGLQPTEIQVLTPRRKDSICSANNLNKILQSEINKNTECISRGDCEFRKGDKIMQIKNNYDKETFNGDMGYISEIDAENKRLTADFIDVKASYNFSDLDELSLAYATTIHKSQGSEYPIVVIPMLFAFNIMLKRNLIYTAITRAKKLCVIVGDVRALYKAINDNSYVQRNTYLCAWLNEFFNIDANGELSRQPIIPEK